MTRILALDIAGNIGVCDWKIGEKPIFYSWKVSREGEVKFESWKRKSARAFKEVRSRLKLNDIDEIIIEAPVQQNNGFTNADTTASTFVLLGAVLGIAGQKPVRIMEGKVNSVRKHFIGHGNLKKDIAKARVRQTCIALGWEPKNYDESDAGALAHYHAAVNLRLATLVPSVAIHHKPAPL